MLFEYKGTVSILHKYNKGQTATESNDSPIKLKY